MSTQHVVHKVFAPGLPGDGFTPAEASSMRADVAEVVADNILAKGREFDVKAYGATGNGVTDDTAAIKAAVAAMPRSGGLGGGQLVFPKGEYLISEEILISTPGTTVRGTGGMTAYLKAAPTLTGAMIRFRDSTNAIRGVYAEDLFINMGTSTADGIVFESAYDQCGIRNCFIFNLNGASSGVSIIPNPGGTGAAQIGQTFYGENVWVDGKNGNWNGKAWKIIMLQEAVFDGCKGIGGGEVAGSGTSFYVEGCKGIVFNGCSAATADIGWNIVSSTLRSTDTITIDTPTLEGLATAIQTSGANSTYRVVGVDIRNPRTLTATTQATGPIRFVQNTSTCRIDSKAMEVVVGATCDQIHIFTDDASKVTDNGTRTGIIEWPNAGTANGGRLTFHSPVSFRQSTQYRDPSGTRSTFWETLWSASAGSDNGLITRYAGRNVEVIAADGIRRHFYLTAAGTARETMRLENPAGSLDTGMFLLVNIAGVVSLQRVTVGAADSGGTGRRALTVAN